MYQNFIFQQLFSFYLAYVTRFFAIRAFSFLMHDKIYSRAGRISTTKPLKVRSKKLPYKVFQMVEQESFDNLSFILAN